MDSYDELTNPRPGARQPAARRSADASAGVGPHSKRSGARPDDAGGGGAAEQAAPELPVQEPQTQEPQTQQPAVPKPTAPQAPAPRSADAAHREPRSPAPAEAGRLPTSRFPRGGTPTSGHPTGEPPTGTHPTSGPPAGAPPTSALPASGPRAGGSQAAPEAGGGTPEAGGGAPGNDEAGPGRDEPPAAPRTGINGLSFRYQVVAALALAGIGVVVCVHLLMVFLHVAPTNTATKQHARAVNDWVLPEFEQNWKLFAPNPLQQNIAVEARAQVRTASGDDRTTGWYNFSALDGAAIDGNPLPSHTQQNELRRAWDFFLSSHDNDNRPVGTRGTLSEDYLRRITVLRLSRVGVGGKGSEDVVQSVQVRSMTTNVQPPPWSGNPRLSTKSFYRTLSWWPVNPGDLPLNAAAAVHPEDTRTEAKAR